MDIEKLSGDAGFDTLNIVLFGGPGEGKSTGALSAPDPMLYLSTEQKNALLFGQNLHGTDVDMVVLGEDDIQSTLTEFIQHAKDGDYETVVIDAVGEVRNRVLSEIGGSVARPTLQAHGDANYVVSSFIREIIALPMNSIFICHEDIQTDETGETLHVPHVGGKEVPRVLGQLADVIGYCKLAETDDGPVPYAQFVGNKSYSKDRTAKLGNHAVLDIMAWITTIEGEV